MVDVWYLIARTPAPSVDVWPIGEDACDPANADRTAGYIAAALTALSAPPGWPDTPGWDLSMGPGFPDRLPADPAPTYHDTPPGS